MSNPYVLIANKLASLKEPDMAGLIDKILSSKRDRKYRRNLEIMVYTLMNVRALGNNVCVESLRELLTKLFIVNNECLAMELIRLVSEAAENVNIYHLIASIISVINEISS